MRGIDLKSLKLFIGWGGGRAKPLFLLSISFAMVIGLASYFKVDGIRSVMDSDRKIQSRMEELKKTEAENAALRERIRSVQDGSYLMEKYAREKLYLARKNEMVFRFNEEKKGSGEE